METCQTLFLLIASVQNQCIVLKCVLCLQMIQMNQGLQSTARWHSTVFTATQSLFWRRFTSTLYLASRQHNCPGTCWHVAAEREVFPFPTVEESSCLCPPPLVIVFSNVQPSGLCCLNGPAELALSCQLRHSVVPSLLPEHMNQLAQTHCLVQKK